ncbi:MAG: negative regulator of sigma-X activity [Neobacillus sp.]
MRKSEWSDKQLEELLRQMPKIQDHRHPRDIYQNLSVKKRKRPVWLLPGIATAAAALLFLILIPKLMVGTEYSLDRAQEEKSSSAENFRITEDNANSIMMEKQDDASLEEGLTHSQLDQASLGGSKTLLFEEEIGTGKVVTYWIPDSQVQNLIPISTVVTQEEGANWLTVFTETMEKLTEEEWGLSEFYPLNATFTLDTKENSLLVDVPKDHKYGQGSAMETNFISSLVRNTASNSDISKIKFFTDGQPGIELGNYGVLNELTVNRDENRAYFLFTPEGEDLPMLVPSSDSYKDIDAALQAMMKGPSPETGLSSSLLPSIQIQSASISGTELVITLREGSSLENNLDTLYSIEAILLTAKDFGLETVLIENAPIEYIGPYHLAGEIKVPLAANYRPL